MSMPWKEQEDRNKVIHVRYLGRRKLWRCTTDSFNLGLAKRVVESSKTTYVILWLQSVIGPSLVCPLSRSGNEHTVKDE